MGQDNYKSLFYIVFCHVKVGACFMSNLFHTVTITPDVLTDTLINHAHYDPRVVIYLYTLLNYLNSSKYPYYILFSFLEPSPRSFGRGQRINGNRQSEIQYVFFSTALILFTPMNLSAP